MRVIGIDVAPGKGGHICEDGSLSLRTGRVSLLRTETNLIEFPSCQVADNEGRCRIVRDREGFR